MPHPHSSSNHPLKIVPKELIFPPPLNRVITNILKLNNVSQSPIAYKVKTTAPQRYCVRPNNGVLAPGETIEVQVLLNYIKDAPPNLDIKDKFQIQSIVLTGPYNANDLGEVWAKATSDQISKQKLKARFTPAAAPLKSHTSSSSLLGSTVTPGQPTETPDAPLPLSSTSSTSSLLSESITPTPQHPPPQQQSHSHIPSDDEGITPKAPTVTASSELSQQHSQYPYDVLDTNQIIILTARRYFTPRIQVNIVKERPKSEISLSTSMHLPDDTPQKPLPVNKSVEFEEPPKQTGDYVVDTVANVTTLRKALEQVSSLKNEKEGASRENQRLNDQVKSLLEQVHRLKEEGNQVGLRHRDRVQNTMTSPPNPALTTQQMEIQIQTKVFLIVILVFAVIGFILGRLSR